MTAATISATETFVREQYTHPMEAGLPLAPTFRAIFDTLLSMTTTSVGQSEVKAAGVNDATRYTVKLALKVMGEQYSDEMPRLILSLNDNDTSNVH